VRGVPAPRSSMVRGAAVAMVRGAAVAMVRGAAVAMVRGAAVAMVRGAAVAMVRALAIAAVAAIAATAAFPSSAPARPQLSVRSAALIELGTGQRLYGLNADERVPIASATKLMTALVTLEHVHQLGKMFTQPVYYSSPADSQIGLVPGERMSVHDLLIALMLPSADDAAEDLAFNVGGGSVTRFIGMMNARARELGLRHTRYSTPIGLDTSGNYSSASDLVKLAAYDLTHSRYFARIVALPHAVLHSGSHPRFVVNRNDLVGRIPWINGVKTGHTSGARYVLVGAGTRGGMTLLSAVLGTSSEASRDSNTLGLLGYGFSQFKRVTPVTKDAILARPTVKDRPGFRAELIAAKSVTNVVPRGARVRVSIEVPRRIAGPLEYHAVLGSAVVLAGRRVIARVPLLLAHRLPAVSPVAVAARFITRPVTLVLLVVLLGGVIVLAVIWRWRSRVRSAADPEPA
jgi:D-alanyl-D-alanine carboxypeptidase (penicillin-binding protein 5/6)